MRTHPLSISSYLQEYRVIFISGLFILISLLGIGQDFIHSRVNHNSFYLSESFLYKISWLLFIPMLFLGGFLMKKVDQNFPRVHSRINSLLIIIVFSVLHLVITSVSIYFLSSLFFNHTYAPDRVFQYFFAEDLYLILLIYAIGFIGLDYVRKPNRSGNAVLQKPPLEFIQVHTSNKIIPLATKEILYLKADRPYIAIVTREGRYLQASTLRKILAHLDSNCFIRIHRSSIVNVHYISFLKSRSNGDYDIHMENGEVIRMSRNYSQAFKEKVQKIPRLST